MGLISSNSVSFIYQNKFNKTVYLYSCAVERKCSHKPSLAKRIKQSSPWRRVQVEPKYRVTCHINISYCLQNSRFSHALHVSRWQEENGLIHKLVSLFAQSVTSLRRVRPLRDSPISHRFFSGESHLT